MSTKLGLILGGLLAPAVAETIHGAAVFSRHGDRTTKHYGAQGLTSLGLEQCFQVGGQYRARYLDSDSPHRILGISEFAYASSQVYASAPDQAILLGTATAFLQGLYPPLEGTNPQIASVQLNNGSESSNPLGGYQYVTLHGQSADAPDAIWIKGDDGCPAAATAQKRFEESAVFQDRVDETKSFYETFEHVLADVYDYTSPSDNLSYANAYDIYDLVNVARIHNTSSAAIDVSDEDLSQLRTLADSAEFGYNFNASEPERSIHARTLAAGILELLTQTVASRGAARKFSLLAGSYDTMLAFFGVTGLSEVSVDFTGLPHYASTLAFELFTEDDDADGFPEDTDDLRVRFLFQNGTEGELTSFPLFGRDEDSYPWPEFVEAMSDLGLSSVETWCSTCKSELPFCAAYEDRASSTAGVKSGMSKEVKGGIAMLTIGSVALAASVLFFVFAARKLKRSRAATTAGVAAPQKGSLDTGHSADHV